MYFYKPIIDPKSEKGDFKMKTKGKLILGLGTAALMIGGVSIGLVRANAAQPVKATTQTHTTLYLQLNSSYWGQATAYYTAHVFGGDNNTTWPGLDLGSGSGNALLSVTIPAAQAGYTGVTFARWADAGHSTQWNQAELKDFSAEQYNCFTNTAWSSVTGSVIETYTVTERAVKDGAIDSGTSWSEMASSSSAFTPSNHHIANYAFGGWFTNSACTAAYTATTLSANTTLYAKYTTGVFGFLYFQCTSGNYASGTSIYVYTFGGSEAMGAWPGTQVTAVTDGVGFYGDGTGGNSYGGIWRVPYMSNADDTKFIINNNTSGSTNQSADLKINAGAYYTYQDPTDSTGNANRGAAAKVIFDMNAARLAVSAGGSILEKSYCGVSASKAGNLVEEYNAMKTNTTALGIFNASTDYTYDSTNTSQSVNVNFSGIEAQLAALAGASSAFNVAGTSDTGSIALMSVIAVTGVAAAGAFFFFRKKHVA
jgi:hypothetical protein